MKRRLGVLPMLLVSLGVSAPAFAEPYVEETCTDSLGATVITYDCGIVDTCYAVGNLLTVTVSWNADAGMAMFDDLVSRKPYFTPKDKRDAVEGEEPTILSVVDGNSGEVTFTFLFTQLHATGNGGKGNAKFFLLLKVDEDGDGVLDEESAKFGINVHVEECESGTEAIVTPAGRWRQSSEDPAVHLGTWGTLKSAYGDRP